MKTIEDKALFVSKWFGGERDIKHLLFEIADLQLAINNPERRKNIEMTLATITSIITRLSMTYSEEDEIRTMADEIIEMDYEMCVDKCKDMTSEKFYHNA